MLDSDKAQDALQNDQALAAQDGVFTPLIKKLTETVRKDELESHLEADEAPICTYGASKRAIRSLSGSFELDNPRDPTLSFEPQLIDAIKHKIFSMFQLGMSYQDIASHIAELHGLGVSNALISSVSDKIIPELKQWRQRSLKSHYPLIWLDVMHYKVKDDGGYDSKSVYTLLGLNLDGKKEVLGLYLCGSVATDFWFYVLTDLRNRGVKDILIVSVDDLKGFKEAINCIFPKTEIQFCITHQIRNSLKYVASKNKKVFMADLASVYKAVSKEAAEIALDELEGRWGAQYPMVLKSWRDSWENLSVYFKYPDEFRRVVYTTNAIETVHRQYRKLTKTKRAFPDESSLTKLLYMGIQNASRKWTKPLLNWNLTLSQLSIYFAGRLDNILNS